MNSAVNIIEDGFEQEWAFLMFALGTAAMWLTLIALTAVLAFSGRGARRMLGLIPFGTALGIVLYVKAAVSSWS